MRLLLPLALLAARWVSACDNAVIPKLQMELYGITTKLESFLGEGHLAVPIGPQTSPGERFAALARNLDATSLLEVCDALRSFVCAAVCGHSWCLPDEGPLHSAPLDAVHRGAIMDERYNFARQATVALVQLISDPGKASGESRPDTILFEKPGPVSSRPSTLVKAKESQDQDLENFSRPFVSFICNVISLQHGKITCSC